MIIFVAFLLKCAPSLVLGGEVPVTTSAVAEKEENDNSTEFQFLRVIQTSGLEVDEIKKFWTKWSDDKEKKDMATIRKRNNKQLRVLLIVN